MKQKSWGVVEELCVKADTDTALRAAMEIVFTEHPQATHFSVQRSERDGDALILYWSQPLTDDATPLPFPIIGADAAAGFIRQWLTHSGRQPAEEPDTDGSVKAGFRITAGCTYPSHVKHAFGYRFCVIETCWIVYGK